MPMKNLELCIAALRYRWKLAFSIAILATAGLVIVVWFLPNQYSATTTILVDPQKVPDRYVATTVTEDPNERLSNLTQEVLSRSRLSQIVEKLHLYPEMYSKQGSDFVIAYLRKQIQIQVKKQAAHRLAPLRLHIAATTSRKLPWSPTCSQRALSTGIWSNERISSKVQPSFSMTSSPRLVRVCRNRKLAFAIIACSIWVKCPNRWTPTSRPLRDCRPTFSQNQMP